MTRSIKSFTLVFICMLVVSLALSHREVGTPAAALDVPVSEAAPIDDSISAGSHDVAVRPSASLGSDASVPSVDGGAPIYPAPVLGRAHSVKHLVAPQIRLLPLSRTRSTNMAGDDPQPTLPVAFLGYTPIPVGAIPIDELPCRDRSYKHERGRNKDDCSLQRRAQIAEVPEPTTLVMFSAGLALMIATGSLGRARVRDS